MFNKKKFNLQISVYNLELYSSLDIDFDSDPEYLNEVFNKELSNK